jgi:hypothetical protein
MSLSKRDTAPWSQSASELYRPSDRRLTAKWLPTFSDRGVPHGQRDGSLRPYSRVSRQEPLLFYQVAPQLYSRGWVDPVPDLLLLFFFLFFSGSAGNRTRTSGSVAKNSDHYITEAVTMKLVSLLNFIITTYLDRRGFELSSGKTLIS